MTMGKKWGAILMLAVVVCVLGGFQGYAQGDGAPDASDGIRIYDMAGILEGDKEQFQDTITDYQEKWKLDILVVTTNEAEGKSSTEYADDFYDAGMFGQGKDKDGILFLIDMDNRELTFSTSGKAIRIFTDARIEDMLDGVYEGASRGDYGDCVRTFLGDVERYCKAGIPNGQYHYDTETGKVSVYKSIRWYEALLALAVSGFVAGGVCLGIKRQYGMEESQGQIRNLNMAYRTDAKFVYDNRSDRLSNKFVTSRCIPRSTGNSGSSGGHSSSGRSSTHRSSSGRSHGGGSRKF